ncbi:hypothetical protein PHAVU_008G224400 [Phaseolus vulgaris]|uniref:MENTAL domain-containing protein n=1 Tax=Phaseolus vulgaris TaxID=3885 RepID=V7B871_PHAVU|nr:hypothetical protein PHAVU_008G224400g [Phaseolus vulgaris]ESW13765.1 hypothetical protein PHAVU_008G224400g [Phaseolus vulgaris]
MGFSKEEKSKRVLRGVKIVFFFITMVFSLLIFYAPVLLAIADALVPSALFSAFSPSSSLFSHFQNYHFGYSLIDIPLLSIARSLLILCVYSFCDGPKLSRGPYLGVTMLCSVMSLIFVCLKVIYVLSYDTIVQERGSQITLFVWSCSLAVGHVVVAYRTSCRERRKLLVYKIDIEGVRACSSYFISLQDKTEKEENDICLFSCK